MTTMCANSSWRLVGGEKANFCPFKRDRENEIDNNTYVLCTYGSDH